MMSVEKAILLFFVSAFVVNTGASQSIVDRSTDNVEILEFEEPVEIRSINGGHVSSVNILFRNRIREESESDGWYLRIQSLSEDKLHNDVDSVKVKIEDNKRRAHSYDLQIDEYQGVFSEHSTRKGDSIYQEYRLLMGRRMIKRIAIGTFAEVRVDNSIFRLNTKVFDRARKMLSLVSP